MSEPRYPNLFSSFKLRDLTIPNRVCMAPMSTNLGTNKGAVTPRQIAFYRARAAGGVGMIIVEFCCVHRASGRSEPRQLSLETTAHLDGHRHLVEAITGAGSIACLQLQHGGTGVHRDLVEGGVAVGPCDIKSRTEPDKLTARALSNDEIENLIECFGKTAELGVQAGYQAFELHGAHGYLLTSFISPFYNQRDDKWGGDEDRRLAFPLRVIQRVRQAIGNRPLIYRISADEFHPRGNSIEAMERISPKLVAAGVDCIHVSIGLGATSFDKVIEPMSTPEAWRLPYARRIREATGVPVIAVGQIRWPARAEQALVDGDTDLIALGRPLLADPEWANKAKAGNDKDIRPCTSCNFCVAFGSTAQGYAVCAENPRTGHELDPIPDAGTARGQRAFVLGGGPGGIAAALLLDQAGFKTELHESRAGLGGGLIASAAPPGKDKLVWYQDYLERQLKNSGVTLKLDTQADIDAVVATKPAIVVVATGGHPVKMPIKGIELPLVHGAYELLMGDDAALPPPAELPVLVYGGGETGCETAEYLAERGYAVILVTRSPAAQLARSAEMIYRGVLRKRLAESTHIRIIDNTEVIAIAADGSVTLEGQHDIRSELKVASFLLAQGREPHMDLTDALAAAGVPFAVIGDAKRGGRIGDAVHDAYAAVVSLCATTAPVRQLSC